MADLEISNLTTTTTAADADHLTTVQGGVNKKITVANTVASQLLAKRPAATTENSIPQWDATNGTLKGGKTLPTLADDMRWETIDTGSYTATPLSSSQLTMSDTTGMVVGLPIRYSDSGGPFYGIITAVVANTSITIAGAPFDTTPDDVTALAVGQPEQVVQQDFFVSGTYGDGVADLLAADNDSAFKWGRSVGHLVAFSAQHSGVDTGAEPKVNVKVNTVAVSTEDGGNGLQLGAAATWVDGSAVAIDAAAYDIQRGEALEIACTVAGGTGDAANLTVTCLFVLA